MIRLTIKGTVEEAIAALDIRQLPRDMTSVRTVKSDLGSELTQVNAYQSELDRITDWFVEPGKAPFPAGTLMLVQLDRRLADEKC